MHALKLFAISLVVFLVLDFLWLGYLAKGLYIKHYSDWLRLENGSLKPLWWSAGIVYLLFALGITFFVIPLSQSSLLNALLYGLFFGFLMYGVYNFTSLAVFKNWPIGMAFIDTLWGGCLCGLTALFTLYFSKLLR